MASFAGEAIGSTLGMFLGDSANIKVVLLASVVRPIAGSAPLGSD